MPMFNKTIPNAAIRYMINKRFEMGNFWLTTYIVAKIIIIVIP